MDQRSSRGASRSAGLIRPLPPPFYCIFRPLFSAAGLIPADFFWKFSQKTSIFRSNWQKLEKDIECFRMLVEKTCFLGDSGDLFFLLFFGIFFLNFPKKFSKIFGRAPKIDFYCIFRPLFFKISEKFSKTAPSAPFSSASRPKAAGLIRGSRAPPKGRGPPLEDLCCTYLFFFY